MLFQNASKIFFSLERVGEQNLTEKKTNKPSLIWAEELWDTYMYLLQKVHADCEKKLQNCTPRQL